MPQANPAPGYRQHPDHTVIITPHSGHVRVAFNGRTIAESDNTLAVRESRYPAVLYFPRADVAMDLLQPTAHQTHCPFKGDARYWSVTVDGKTAENAVWGYDTPFDEAAALAGHVAFYPDRIDAIEES